MVSYIIKYMVSYINKHMVSYINKYMVSYINTYMVSYINKYIVNLNVKVYLNSYFVDHEMCRICIITNLPPSRLKHNPYNISTIIHNIILEYWELFWIMYRNPWADTVTRGLILSIQHIQFISQVQNQCAHHHYVTAWLDLFNC